MLPPSKATGKGEVRREKRTEALKFQDPREADGWREKLGGQVPSLPPPQSLNSLEHYLLPVNLHSELCFLRAHCVNLSGSPQQPSHQGVSAGSPCLSHELCQVGAPSPGTQVPPAWPSLCSVRRGWDSRASCAKNLRKPAVGRAQDIWLPFVFPQLGTQPCWDASPLAAAWFHTLSSSSTSCVCLDGSNNVTLCLCPEPRGPLPSSLNSQTM